MIILNFDEKIIKQYESGILGSEIISSMFPDLLNSAIAVRVNENLYDLSQKINCSGNIKIITKDDETGLEIIRHDAAHIMAEAVKSLFPNVQATIGPTIKDGFYYDFATDGYTFSTEDISKIEDRMQEIIDNDQRFIREVWSREKAIEFFKNKGENYKIEIISSISSDEDLTIYKQGEFIDLCRGPHSPSTGKVKAFKLMKVAGAYWRGDSSKVMLQRIYGTAWRSEKELKLYLQRLEEAEKRDHRKVALDMDLFHIQNEGLGQIFWHEKGWTLFRTLESYIRAKLTENGYIEVKTPILLDKSLWEKSGHWEKFREHMFLSQVQEEELAIKPMNCPCHVQIFNTKIRSYRDLPMRMAEFGVCHRNEPSGSLHGLMRVRGFTQDDAHIFCTEDQVTSETLKFCDLLQEVYKELGFTDVEVKFSDRPLKRAGDDKVWDKAEEALLSALKLTDLKYTFNSGEGAFYGPKLEFILKDAIGREWQCGTLQVDFVLPSRLNAFFIGQDGQKHHPVMLHRAILGTFERFIGILIEHYYGKFPFWLAPVQFAILTVTDIANDYALLVNSRAKELKFRVQIDLTNEKIGYKIRMYSLQKVPVLYIIGKSEMENNTVSIRYLSSKEQFSLPLDEAFEAVVLYFNKLN